MHADLEDMLAALEQAKLVHQKAAHNARVLTSICHHDLKLLQKVETDAQEPLNKKSWSKMKEAEVKTYHAHRKSLKAKARKGCCTHGTPRSIY
jgi:hypothetical protein